MLSVLMRTCWWRMSGRKHSSARCTARSSRQFMCHDFSVSDHVPKAGLPSLTAPQPVLDASVATFFLLITWPIRTPRRYRVILCQGVSVCKQSRISLMRKVPVHHAFCGTRLFSQSRSGRICRSPSLHTVEAAAIWPSVLWKHFSGGEHPNLKTARELISFCERSSNRRARILIEFSSTPKKEMFWLGTSMLFCIFTVSPKLWIWARSLNLSCFRGERAVSMHFVNVWGPDISRRVGPWIGTLSPRMQISGSACGGGATWMWK